MSLNVQMFQGPQVLERRRPVTGGSGSWWKAGVDFRNQFWTEVADKT
jgi:hypothetical protein